MQSSDENVYSLILRNVPDEAICVMEIDGTIYFCNKALAHRFGKIIEEMTGTVIWDYFPEKVAKSRKKHVEHVMHTKKSIRYEDLRGSIWNDSILYPILDKNGNVDKIVLFARDITYKKEIEQKLRYSEQKWKSLLNSISTYIMELDLGFNITYLNKAQFDHNIDFYIGKNIFEITPSPIKELIERSKKDILNGKEFSYNLEYTFPNENTIHYDVRIIPIIMDAQVSSLMLIAYDVTDRFEMVKSVVDSEDRYRALFEGASEGIVVADMVTRDITFVNPAVCALLEYTEEELISMKVEECHPEPNREKIITQFKNVVEGTLKLLEEIPVITKTGIIKYVNISTSFVTIDNKQYIVGYMSDITEKIITSEALIWEATVSDILAQLSKEILELESIDDISARILMYAKNFTKSQFGYVGYIDENTGHLVCPTMTRDIWEMCQVPDKDIIFKEFGGVWGWVLEHKQSAMINDLSLDDRSSGTPEGHLPLTNVLSVPAMLGDDLLGQITLANSKTVYTEKELKVIERLATFYAIAVHKMRNERALIESEQMFNQVFNVSSEAMRLIDINKTIINCNQRYAEYNNTTVQEIIGQKCSDFICSQNCDSDECSLIQILNGKKSIMNTTIQSFEDQKIRYLIYSVVPYHDQKGTMIGFLESFRDISELKLVEESLQKSKDQFKDLVQKARTAIVQLDKNGRIVLFNEYAEQLFEYSFEEVRGKYVIGTIAPMIDSEGKNLDAMIKEFLTANPDIYEKPNENENITKSGKRLWVSWHNRQLVDDHGNFDGILSIGIDITEKKIAELALKVARQAADEANRAKSEFLANMSHELRTPLNSVLGFSQILEMENFGKLNEAQKEYVNYIKESGSHLLEMVNDILDLSKIEAGKMKIEMNSFDLNKLLERVPLTVRSIARVKNIQIHTEIDENVKMLKGDEIRIKQVIYNLLSNAIKFTPENKNVGLKAQLAKEWVEIIVWDEGIGIPETFKDRIFDAFEQVKSSRNSVTKGTGLGLSITKKIIELHGGSISVKSKENEGSTFTIFLPGVIEESEQNKKDVSISSQESYILFQNKKILIVEDDEINLKFIQGILESQGMELSYARNGKEALSMIKENIFNLILLDIQMPDQSGVEIMKTIKYTLKIKTPVVALTAYAMKGDKLTFIQEGFDNYLSKPIDVNLLLELVKKYT